MRETWYVLDDDSVIHPNEVDGNMTHKNGKVAMRGDVPSTRGVEVDDKTGKRLYDGPHDHLHKDWPGNADKPKKSGKDDIPAKAAEADDKSAAKAKDLKADDEAAAYKTRDSKAK